MSTWKRQQEIDTSDEAALVHGAKQGDIAAFEQLVERYTAMIFRVAMHIMNSREDAEDIVQDAFLKAFQHLQRFEERSRFSTWLTRIAVNVALMKLRSSRRATTISMDQEANEGSTLADKVADWKPNPSSSIAKPSSEKSCNEPLLHCHSLTVLSSCCVTSKVSPSRIQQRCWD